MRAPVGRLVVSAALLVVMAAGVVALLLGLRSTDTLRVEVVQAGLDHPWDVAFADDGRMLVTERIGRIRVYASAEPGAALLHTVPVPAVHAELESGLMGTAVAGESVFVCASVDEGEAWRIALLRSSLAADGGLSSFEPIPIGEMRGAPRHQGCAVEVDRDDHLWIAVGDANLPGPDNPAQDPDRLNGKVLRVHLDGSVPADNPSAGSPVFSLGHRNPQGIAMRGDLVLVAEHGTDENDEVNVIVPGGNYGYPCFTGDDDVGPYPDGCGSISDYLPAAWASGTPTLATSGATFLSGTGWRDWEGDLIVSALKEEDLRRFAVATDGRIAEQETLLDRRFGRLRAVVIGPDGALYVSTANGKDDRIIRVTRDG